MKKLMHQQNRLWDYQILKQLGKGEYGQVFQVRLKKDNKIYALKKINIIAMHEKEKIQAFRQIKALKLLSHPCIVQYHDSFLSMDNIYIVTEYAEKGDLSNEIKARIKKQKKFTEDELWDIFESLVLAIKHLHQKNIIHRDLKVQNIFLTADNKFKVGDLGMSKIVYDNTQMLSTRVGTPIYFAPEVIQHKLYSFPVDIWALGCVFYYMASLQHPYKDATIQTLGYYIVDKQPKPIKGAYSPQLIAFITGLLDKNPQTRPTIHDCYKKLKQRKQLTIRNKVSIFNLKQILALKAHHLNKQQVQTTSKQKVKKQQLSPLLRYHKSRLIQNRIFRLNETEKLRQNQGQNQNQKMQQSHILQQNPEGNHKMIQQKRNMSLYLPKNRKYNLKSSFNQKQYEEQCSSPMIKSNGFSITLASPEKDRHGNKLTEKNRSENKYRMGSNTVRYNISEDRNNVTFNLNLSPDPYKKEQSNFPKRIRARGALI